MRNCKKLVTLIIVLQIFFSAFLNGQNDAIMCLSCVRDMLFNRYVNADEVFIYVDENFGVLDIGAIYNGISQPVIHNFDYINF